MRRLVLLLAYARCSACTVKFAWRVRKPVRQAIGVDSQRQSIGLSSRGRNRHRPAFRATWPAVTLTAERTGMSEHGRHDAGRADGLAPPSAIQPVSGTLLILLPWGSTTLGPRDIGDSQQAGKPQYATTSGDFYGQITRQSADRAHDRNASTTYSQTLSQTSLTYGFVLLLAPGCAALTTSAGSFASRPARRGEQLPDQRD